MMQLLNMRDHFGMIVTLCAGLCMSFALTFGKLVNSWNFPFFFIMGCSQIPTSLLFGAACVITKPALPSKSSAKFMILRALFGSLTFGSSCMAVLVGAAPGDVSALTSINMVCAAVLGHVFLKENLRLVHIAALACSLSGAMFISKPAFLFGAESGGSTGGNMLALASGFAHANVFICARKSADVPVSMMTLGPALCSTVLFLVLPFTPMVQESWAIVAEQPFATCGLIVVAFVHSLVAITLSTIGEMMCPAAVSATIFTASSMVFGYIAQTVLFMMMPDVLTLLGATLMFAAVLIMAVARIPQQGAAPAALPEDIASFEARQHREDACSDTESFASFVASEFAEVDPHKDLRLRRPDATASASSLEAHTVGAVATMAL
eukprot:TRINITY_DN20633_c0_g2_i1.p1 TRINITY_DN20633_c0_g2~~TRINITY_DN20633_c0_g2_i1.p1  ORF type:complete len:379 (+),score=68.31 TRINITY_DN20633_c0_g2_i1:41-1177(+)